MARKKNYQLDETRLNQVLAATDASVSAQSVPASDTNPDDALIDLLALVGPEDRLGTEVRHVDLRIWLGRGIDPWVWASVNCLKARLRSGSVQPSTVVSYGREIVHFFDFLIEGRATPRVASPADLSPMHIEAFVGWLTDKRAKERKWGAWAIRSAFNAAKAVLVAMFERKLIPGEKSRFFKRGMGPGVGDSNVTSLSEAEQVRMVKAIQADLSASYHGRLSLAPWELQALRLLVVAHRQGKNTTPMLELDRNSMIHGMMPGTVAIRTVKQRGKKVRSSPGRAAKSAEGADAEEEQMLFDLSEGGVLRQAIKSTDEMVEDAPARIKNRVWLYRSRAQRSMGQVSCLSANQLHKALGDLSKRHKLSGDDGKPLRLTLGGLRKSYFDRSFRINDGDLSKVANQMGNTPGVAGRSYPSMNAERKAEAAAFMNEDFVNLQRPVPRVIEIAPVKASHDGTPTVLPQKTPVSGCKDTLRGEYAPGDGSNHCDRFVMCLFCHSFAIIGTADELWRLFSFQAFAKAELEFLDKTLGPERTDDDVLEDLRARYRLAVPYIDDFTKRQFPAGTVREARTKAEEGLHPFWIHQMSTSRHVHARLTGYEPQPAPFVPPKDGTTGDRHGA